MKIGDSINDQNCSNTCSTVNSETLAGYSKFTNFLLSTNERQFTKLKPQHSFVVTARVNNISPSLLLLTLAYGVLCVHIELDRQKVNRGFVQVINNYSKE